MVAVATHVLRIDRSSGGAVPQGAAGARFEIGRVIGTPTRLGASIAGRDPLPEDRLGAGPGRRQEANGP